MKAPRLRILVVEDDASVRELLRTVLEGAGYEVREATGGHEAVRLHRAEAADLVITDIFMPGGDGLETLQELDAGGGGPPVIAISGGSASLGLDGLALAGALGAAGRLRKPFRPEEILHAVAEALGRHHGPAAAPG